MSCNKITYPTKAEAASFVRRRAHAAGDRRQRIYHCAECSGWHASTHADERASSRQRQRRRRAGARSLR